ncbi:MAG: hypothetical protein A2X36_02025 [Elusimicrobia bacterium GWA2_69_24]|nr:MAG: hypothetical protein A2X36_02025 [Elusimicrobia bacterium GWA2_69_24]HBL16086.1 hypothetical protein [Elusimicrobiota bacterium]
MKILFVSESDRFNDGCGQMLLTGSELRSRGHEVLFALPGTGTAGRRIAAAGFPVRDLRIRHDYDLLRALKLRALCALERPDLIHAHHPRAHAVCLLAKSLGASAPLVVTRRIIFRIRRNPFSLLKYRSRRIARFIAVCAAAKNELVKAGVPERRVEILPSAVDMGLYDAPRQAREALRFAPPFRIGIIGHHAWHKGHEVLLEAARPILERFPGTVFVFAGRDTEKLRRKAAVLGLNASVEILGERADVPELLAGLHLFAMPSIQQGLPYALIEAQAAGVPAVAAGVGGILDVLLNEETGLVVPPQDSGKLAEAVIRVLSDETLARRLAANGLERIQREFSVSVVTDRLEALYQAVLRP